ncbi:MAG: hypothetical protein QHH14_05705 [Clostridiales bacterium]|nr:hypothetical protein [Clostridiales bacterium]
MLKNKPQIATIIIAGILAGFLGAERLMEGQSRGGFPSRLTYAGSALWTKAHDISIEENLGYCAFLNGLVVLDLSDLKKPTLLSQLYLGGGYAIAVRQKTAYVAAGKEGLKIIDVSDPKSPLLKGGMDTNGEARDVALSKSYAFIADGAEGLVIIDISNPADPKTAGKWDSPGESMGIVVRDEVAYIADGSAGLQVVNVKDPAKATSVGACDTDGTAEDIAISGNHAYIADGSSGLKVMDISKPFAPRQIASLTTSGYCRGVSADGSLLGAGNLYDGGYQVIDISNPAAPVILATKKYTMYNESWNVVLRGNRLCVLDYFSGIGFFDLSAPDKPAMTGFFLTPSSIIAAAFQDQTVYAVGELSGLRVLDISDPLCLRPLAATNIFRGVHGLAVSGAYAYVTDRWSIRVFDVRNPSEARQVHAIRIPSGVPRTVVVKGSIAYLTADHAGLYIIDITDPRAAKILGNYPVPRFTYGMDIDGNFAYLANSDTGFHVVDIRNPASPKLRRSIKLEGEPCGVAVQGKNAYVTCGESGLYVVDISNPDAPKVAGSCATEDFANGIAVSGNFAYVTDGNAGIKKIDISRPESLRVVASFDTPGESTCPVLAGEFLIVPDAFSLFVFGKN